MSQVVDRNNYIQSNNAEPKRIEITLGWSTLSQQVSFGPACNTDDGGLEDIAAAAPSALGVTLLRTIATLRDVASDTTNTRLC